MINLNIIATHVLQGLWSLFRQFSGDLSWRAELQAMFRSSEDYCSFTTNRSCGTHVHISPGVGLMWSIPDLRKIANAILRFEKAWNAIVPVARRYMKYAKSNRFDNPKLAMETDAQCIEAVNACESSKKIGAQHRIKPEHPGS